MHFAFIPYGALTEIDRLEQEMQVQKFMLRMHKDGEKDKGVYINGQIRLLPFGVYEYVFPKEYLGLVLNTLCNNKEPNRYNVPNFFRAMFRKVLKLKPIPKYQKDQRLIWTTENVSILALGIREDSEIIEPKDMGYKNWIHEAL